MAEAEGGRARDRNGRDVIRYSAKIFIPPLGAPPLPPSPPPTGRTIATTMSCSPGARSSGRRDGHDPREGGQGRTDGQAGKGEGGMKGGAPRALHSSSVASRFRSFSISGSVSGSCRDCSTWHRDCSSTRSTSKSSQYNLVSCQFPSTDQRKRSGRNTGETVPEYNFLHAYHSLDGRIGAFGAEYIVTKAVDRHQVKFKLIVTMFVLVEKARSCRQWEQRRKR